MASSTQWHSLPNTNSLSLFSYESSQIPRWPKIDKALASIWAVFSRIFFGGSENIPDQIESQLTSCVIGLSPRLRSRNSINSTYLTQLVNSLSFKFQIQIHLIDSKPVSSRWVDSKSSTRVALLIVSLQRQRSYLLRLPCTKPIVMVKTSPINSMADLEPHPHVIHAPLQHGCFHIPHHWVISHWIHEIEFSYKDANHYGNCFATHVQGTLFFWRHDWIPRSRCLTGHRQKYRDQWTVFGFLSEILVLAWRNCPKPRLELARCLANAYKVRSDLVSLLRTIRSSPWRFRSPIPSHYMK